MQVDFGRSIRNIYLFLEMNYLGWRLAYTDYDESRSDGEWETNSS